MKAAAMRSHQYLEMFELLFEFCAKFDIHRLGRKFAQLRNGIEDDPGCFIIEGEILSLFADAESPLFTEEIGAADDPAQQRMVG